MALTGSVKEELSRLDMGKHPVRKAEVSSLLRFAGGLQIFSGRLMIQAEVDRASTAVRLRAGIAGVFARRSEILGAPAGNEGTEGRYLVRVVRDGEALARQAGLLDSRGNPVRGLPSFVVNGSVSEVEAAWRGAFLARGLLTRPGRSSFLGVNCPSPEAAIALVGAARRLGIEAQTREVRGVDRVVIRDHGAIAALLARIGAPGSLAKWEEQPQQDAKTAAKRVNFDTSNQHRSARAAAAVGARVERALEILGDGAPDSLKYAGELRLAHRGASLEELGRLADPPMSKDTIAGRIRRLVELGTSRASETGQDAADRADPELLWPAKRGSLEKSDVRVPKPFLKRVL